MIDPHDWLADPRPLSECLKDFNRCLNDGKADGAFEVGRAALGIDSIAAYIGLLNGDPTSYETTLRLAMIEAERRTPPSKINRPKD